MRTPAHTVAYRRVRSVLLVAGCIALTATTACAPEVVAGWQPVSASSVTGVQLLDSTGSDATGPESTAPGEGDPAAPSDEATGAAGSSAVSLPESIELARSQLLGERIRADQQQLAARLGYVPGVPGFAALVNEEVQKAIAVTGVAYSPQVYDLGSGLADRGCVSGSIQWPAAQVLSDPTTGPTGGSGTAVTCDVTAAFGSVLQVTMRTVTGSADAVTGDRNTVFTADITTGTASHAGQNWKPEAATELWKSTVQSLRMKHGALSTAALAEPDEAQLALATQALAGASEHDEGALLVTIAPGLISPELVGLGQTETTQPIQAIVNAETVLRWSTDTRLAYLASVGKPFSGATAHASSVPLDCNLLPCVAVTYDDGPGEHTEQLLDVLDAEQARATFYMMGGRAQARPETVKRAVAAGHELGSHTMGHPDLTTISVTAAQAEVMDAAAILADISGKLVNTFRPPYGAINAAVIDAVPLPAVLWSVDTNDWQGPGVDVVISRAVTEPQVGGIVLMHDIHEATVQAASGVVQGLHDRGFTMVTVTELFDGNVPAGRVRSR